MVPVIDFVFVHIRCAYWWGLKQVAESSVNQHDVTPIIPDLALTLTLNPPRVGVFFIPSSNIAVLCSRCVAHTCI